MGFCFFKYIKDNTFAYPFKEESKINKQHIITFLSNGAFHRFIPLHSVRVVFND